VLESNVGNQKCQGKVHRALTKTKWEAKDQSEGVEDAVGKILLQSAR
jgi:hypothetical protein